MAYRNYEQRKISAQARATAYDTLRTDGSDQTGLKNGFLIMMSFLKGTGERLEDRIEKAKQKELEILISQVKELRSENKELALKFIDQKDFDDKLKDVISDKKERDELKELIKKGIKEDKTVIRAMDLIENPKETTKERDKDENTHTSTNKAKVRQR